MSSIEQRLQRLEDIEAIRLLKARYLHACDTKDVPALRACFSTHSVNVDYGAIGQFDNADAFIAIFEAMACHPHIIDMHHGQNPQITTHDENRASAIWDLYFHQINTEAKTLMQLGGYYRDDYCKENGEWRISKTAFTVTSSTVMSYTDSQLLPVFAGKQAQFG